MEIDTLPRPAASAKFRWGDIEDDEPDENGVKKVIEFKFNNGDGNKVKITSRRAAERRAWAKFGDAAVHEDVGARLTIASTEEIILERPRASPGSKAEETKVAGNLLAQLGKGGAFLMVCRTCGKKGNHWTSKCLYKDLDPQPEGFVDKPAASGSTKGAYVPPGMRAGAETTGQEMRRRNEENSVRVTNLSEDTRDADLLELFCTFGSVSRVHVAIDQKTGVSRGFGFVNFVNKDDAERAINKLNGFGYDNLILRVEWTTPRAN